MNRKIVLPPPITRHRSFDLEQRDNTPCVIISIFFLIVTGFCISVFVREKEPLPIILTAVFMVLIWCFLLCCCINSHELFDSCVFWCKNCKRPKLNINFCCGPKTNIFYNPNYGWYTEDSLNKVYEKIDENRTFELQGLIGLGKKDIESGDKTDLKSREDLKF